MTAELRKTVNRTVLASVLVGAVALTALGQDARGQSAPGTDGASVAVIVRGSVGETLDRLKKMVADNGMMVMGELHQGKVLAMTGLKVEAETIFVGNPNVGRQLFSEEPGAGVAVPVRINVYKNANGKTVVRYIPPSRELGAFGNAKVDHAAKMLDGKLQNMVSMLPR